MTTKKTTTKKTTTRKTKIAAVCSNVELTPGELQRLVGERDKFRAQRVRDFKCLRELKGDVEALIAQRNALRRRVEELEAQLGEGPPMRARVAILERTLEEANKCVKLYETKVVDLQERLSNRPALVSGAVAKEAFEQTRERAEKAEAQVAALTAERDGARLDLEKSQDQVAWRNQEMKSQAAALEESERTVATLTADGRALRVRKAELEDQLRTHAERWEDQGATLCESRLETDRMRGEVVQLASAVRTQVERFLLHAGALPAAAAIIPLVELLSEAAVRHRQACLAGGLQEAAAKVQDQVQQAAAEGGQNGGGKWLGGPLIGENGDNVEGDDQ